MSVYTGKLVRRKNIEGNALVLFETDLDVCIVNSINRLTVVSVEKLQADYVVVDNPAFNMFAQMEIEES